MSEEELKRMKDFINVTLKPDKPNEYRLGYEEALRKCYYIVEQLQQRIDKAIDYITTEQLYTNYQWGKSQYAKILKDLLEILGDKE